jgi:hypothetical protein
MFKVPFVTASPNLIISPIPGSAVELARDQMLMTNHSFLELERMPSSLLSGQGAIFDFEAEFDRLIQR